MLCAGQECRFAFDIGGDITSRVASCSVALKTLSEPITYNTQSFSHRTGIELEDVALLHLFKKYQFIELTVISQLN